jgi:O-antigen ligase
METNIPKKSARTENVFMSVMEYGIYLFIVLMFAGKFGTFREIGIFLPASLWLLGCFINKQCYLRWKEPLFLIILFLSLSALISSLLSPDSLRSLSFFKKEYLKVILLYIVISATFSQGDKLQKISFFLAMTGVLYLFLGGYKILTDLLYTKSIQYEETRYYATIFLFFLSFMILQSKKSKNVQNVLWKLPIIGSILGIIVIGVRGSWLGLVGVFGTWAVLSRKKRKKDPAIFKKIIPVVILIMGLMIVFFLFPGQYNLIKEHTQNSLQLTLRFEAWHLFMQMSQERFFFGHGLDDDNMSEHYREFYRETKGESLPAVKPVTPHNQFLKIFYQQGIVGLISYMALFFILYVRSIKGLSFHGLDQTAFIIVAVIAAVTGEYVIRCLSEDRSLVQLGVLLGVAGAYLTKRGAEAGRT